MMTRARADAVNTSARIPSTLRLRDAAPYLERALSKNEFDTPATYAVSDIKIETVKVAMRDGVLLATDLYLPPKLPAPAISLRTPYGRGGDANATLLLAFARRGYVGVAQDCRGTGDSEPDHWIYALYEAEDGYDFVEWASRQNWFDGFLGATGGSYVGQTQWPMATHKAMSTIVPGVSGLGIAANTTHLHMFVNGYARSVGNGELNIGVPYTEIEALIEDETMSTGYFNDPLYKPFSEQLIALLPNLKTMAPREAQAWLWRHYCGLTSKERARFIMAASGKNHVAIEDIEASGSLFGIGVAHDRHHLPTAEVEAVAQSLQAPALVRTAWYDWFLNDALATWGLLESAATDSIKSQCRLVVGPGAHNKLGYNVGIEKHPELLVGHLTTNEMLLRWCEAVRKGETAAWPRVCYYMMGANEWRAASSWPPAEVEEKRFHLWPGGALSPAEPPQDAPPQRYIYDPENPTPTVGGSVVSWLYTPGSVDVSEVQARPDVLTFASEPLNEDLDVVGPVRLTLYASSSAVDTDFAARLSDVFPDGRALQLQNVMLRARYRDIDNPQLLEPGRVYQFEIDMWATANRFKAGHRLRVDISSSDFPKLDRNSNLGGAPGRSVPATQTIYHDREHPSHLTVCVLPQKPA
jgi:uncharacterized protein